MNSSLVGLRGTGFLLHLRDKFSLSTLKIKLKFLKFLGNFLWLSSTRPCDIYTLFSYDKGNLSVTHTRLITGYLPGGK
jgi:hypothetical protein